MIFLFTESKILTATGYTDDDGTKIIDVGSNSNYSCPKVQPFPVKLRSATGGLVNGQPFLCGGFNTNKANEYVSKNCFKLTHSGSWAKDDTAALNTERAYVYGSVVLFKTIFLSAEEPMEIFLTQWKCCLQIEYQKLCQLHYQREFITIAKFPFHPTNSW